MVGILHLPQIAPVAHGYHAVDTEELHLFGRELLPLTLPLGCPGRPLDQGGALQVPDLGSEGIPGRAGARWA